MAKENLFNKTIIILMLVICICCCFMISDNNIAFAAFSTEGYSSVIDDLSIDSSFAVYHYPVDNKDKSLNFINIAESINNELFVYMYNPSADRIASSINLSATTDDSLQIKNYKLKLISSQDALSKYVVEDFRILEGSYRYYNVISIFRPYDANIDKATGNGNVTNEVAYKVGKNICMYEDNGVTKSEYHDIETISITDKFVGYCSYSNGFSLLPSSCYSHFVAFDTDKPIDKLLEADIYYTTQSYNVATNNKIIPPVTSYRFDEVVEHHKTLTYTDKVTHTGKGLFANTYKWNRIESVENFIQNEDVKNNVYYGATVDVNVGNKLTDDTLAKLQNKKWVLRFEETTTTSMLYGGNQSTDATIVGNVSILRLKFETNGIVYNLGVIDNKTSQPPTEPPANDEETEVIPLTPEEIANRAMARFKKVLAIVLGILLLALVIPFIPYILQFLWWIISSPYKLIKMINDSAKERKKKKSKSTSKPIYADSMNVTDTSNKLKDKEK